MKENATFVTQSKFFSPVFNAAIFDGPIRIYFAQHQEAQALKVYFSLQERYKHLRENARYSSQKRGGNIFIMLYPTPDTFEMCFDSAPPEALVVRDRIDMDYVIGVKTILDEPNFSLLYEKLDEIELKQKTIRESLTPSEASL